jgi:hypothetical protein
MCGGAGQVRCSQSQERDCLAGWDERIRNDMVVEQRQAGYCVTVHPRQDVVIRSLGTGAPVRQVMAAVPAGYRAPKRCSRSCSPSVRNGSAPARLWCTPDGHELARRRTTRVCRRGADRFGGCSAGGFGIVVMGDAHGLPRPHGLPSESGTWIEFAVRRASSTSSPGAVAAEPLARILLAADMEASSLSGQSDTRLLAIGHHRSSSSPCRADYRNGTWVMTPVTAVPLDGVTTTVIRRRRVLRCSERPRPVSV